MRPLSNELGDLSSDLRHHLHGHRFIAFVIEKSCRTSLRVVPHNPVKGVITALIFGPISQRSTISR